MMKGGGGQINVATSSNQYQQFGSDRTVLYVKSSPTYPGTYNDPVSTFGITLDQIKNLKAGDIIRQQYNITDREDYLIIRADIETADMSWDFDIASTNLTSIYHWCLHDSYLMITRVTISIDDSHLNSSLKAKLRDSIQLNSDFQNTKVTYTYTAFNNKFGISAQNLYSFIPGAIIKTLTKTYAVSGVTNNIVSDHIGIRLSGLEKGDLNTIEEIIIDFNWDDEKITIIPYTWKLDSSPKEYSLNSQYWPDTKTVFSYPASEEWENIYLNATIGDYISVDDNKYLITSVTNASLPPNAEGHKIITTSDREIDIIRYPQSGGGGANRLLGLMLLITVDPIGWEEYE